MVTFTNAANAVTSVQDVRGETFCVAYKLLSYAREQGIYRPSRRKPRPPVPPPEGLPEALQLPLFGGRKFAQIVADRKRRS
jgi:hypothetical protein